MEVAVFIAVLIFFTPIVLSGLALGKATRALRELDELRRHLRQPATLATAEPAKPVIAETPPAPKPPPPVPVAAAPAPPSALPTPKSLAMPLPPARETDVEVALGGKVASFLGAIAVLISIAFFVGYAIQQGLLGPVARVVLGLAAGAALLAGGHLLQRRSVTHVVLARALTGIGAALLYFTVFAAHRLYALIGPAAALGGLIVSALALLALANAYRSQAVAVLGVFGAFLTPWLVDSSAPVGVFPLVYVLLVNVPVLLLARKWSWTALPNVATAFALLHVLVWLAARDTKGLMPGVALVAAIYAQVVWLNVRSAGVHRAQWIAWLDLARLYGAAAAFGLAIVWMHDDAGGARGAALPLFLAAAAHGVLAGWLRRRDDSDPFEAVAYVHVAALFLAAAIPVRFDGLTVPVLWGTLGYFVAALPAARRHGSVAALALLLGLVGLGGVMVDGIGPFTPEGRLFFNRHFGFGVMLTLMLAGQARLRKGGGDDRLDALALIGATGVAGLDAMVRLKWTDPSLGLLTSAILLAAGAIGLAGKEKSLRRGVGIAFLALLPFKIALIDSLLAWNALDAVDPFRNDTLWLRLAILGVAAWLLARSRAGGVALPLVSATALIVLVSQEILRVESDAAQALLSGWLGVCAFVAVAVGLRRRARAVRFYGLALFAITAGKVFLIDLADLRGLERAAAFLALGVLLLALSFIYQRVAKRLTSGTGSACE